MVDNTSQEFQTDLEENVHSFDLLNLKPDLLKGIYYYGFERPSILQSKTILSILKKKDTIVQAQGGTGKTSAFAISILQMIDPQSQTCQALVLSPTRELAQQAQGVMKALGEYLRISVHCCIGGTDILNDQKKLQEGVHIAVGTPGRISDLIQKGFLKADHLKLFVLDEADEMLNRGFQDQIKEILKFLPSDIQTALFTTTMPQEILSLTKEFMRDPATISIENEKLTPDSIKQYYSTIDKEELKFDTLVKLYNKLEFSQCAVYCNKRQTVDELATKLSEQGFTVSSIHGDMDQNQRDLNTTKFTNGTSRILITTDLLARSIDLTQIPLIINFGLPLSKEMYLHRMGKKGSFGCKAVVINLVTPSDNKLLQEIEQCYGIEIKELPVDPSNII